MALSNLTVEEMVAVSQAWVSPANPAQKVLLESARLNPLCADVERTHAALQAVMPTNDPRKAELGRLAAEVDSTHDRIARGLFGLLTELAMLEDDAELIALRDLLFPKGLSSVIQASYRGQAGYAGILRERLTPERRAQLAAIPLRHGNVLERVEAWLGAADRLGALEEERARLEGEKPSFGKQTVLARNGWMRTTNALLSIAALAELDEATDRLLFGPLRDAEARADERVARRKASAVGTEPPAVGGDDEA